MEGQFPTVRFRVMLSSVMQGRRSLDPEWLSNLLFDSSSGVDVCKSTEAARVETEAAISGVGMHTYGEGHNLVLFISEMKIGDGTTSLQLYVEVYIIEIPTL